MDQLHILPTSLQNVFFPERPTWLEPRSASSNWSVSDVSMNKSRIQDKRCQKANGYTRSSQRNVRCAPLAKVQNGKDMSRHGAILREMASKIGGPCSVQYLFNSQWFQSLSEVYGPFLVDTLTLEVFFLDNFLRRHRRTPYRFSRDPPGLPHLH